MLAESESLGNSLSLLTLVKNIYSTIYRLHTKQMRRAVEQVSTEGPETQMNTDVQPMTCLLPVFISHSLNSYAKHGGVNDDTFILSHRKMRSTGVYRDVQTITCIVSS